MTYSASVKAEAPLDLVVIDGADFTGLAESLGVLQRDLEQALFAHRAYGQFTTMAARDPAVGALTIADIMTRPVETLPLEFPLAETVEKFQDGHAAFPSRKAKSCGVTAAAGAFQRAGTRSAA